MGRITYLPGMNYIKDADRLADLISGLMGQLTSEFNGAIDFVQNIRASGLHLMTFPDASTVVPLTHSLRKIPKGTIIIKQDAAASVYAPTGAPYVWTDGQIYLQSSAAVHIALYVI